MLNCANVMLTFSDTETEPSIVGLVGSKRSTAACRTPVRHGCTTRVDAQVWIIHRPALRSLVTQKSLIAVITIQPWYVPRSLHALMHWSCLALLDILSPQDSLQHGRVHAPDFCMK